MKTIKDLTTKNINEIYSIMVNGKRKAIKIDWTKEKDFVIAIFKIEKCTIYDNYDTIEYGIQINDTLRIDNIWQYRNKNSTGTEYRPLYNHHSITKYLIKEGFDV